MRNWMIMACVLMLGASSAWAYKKTSPTYVKTNPTYTPTGSTSAMCPAAAPKMQLTYQNKPLCLEPGAMSCATMILGDYCISQTKANYYQVKRALKPVDCPLPWTKGSNLQLSARKLIPASQAHPNSAANIQLKVSASGSWTFALADNDLLKNVCLCPPPKVGSGSTCAASVGGTPTPTPTSKGITTCNFGFEMVNGVCTRVADTACNAPKITIAAGCGCPTGMVKKVKPGLTHAYQQYIGANFDCTCAAGKELKDGACVPIGSSKTSCSAPRVYMNGQCMCPDGGDWNGSVCLTTSSPTAPSNLCGAIAFDPAKYNCVNNRLVPISTYDKEGQKQKMMMDLKNKTKRVK